MLRRLIPALAAACALTAAVTLAAAEDFPARSISIIVAQPPGGGTDIISRIFAQQLSEQLGKTVLVENKPGAGTIVGTEAAAKAPPDGYTLLAGLTANLAVNPSLFRKLPYDSIRDFTPVGMMAEFPFVLVVSKDFPAKSVKELIAMAKAKPGEINFASAGNGTGQHLSAELFKLMAGVDMTHVPYRGASPAYSDVISGRTPVFFDNLASALGQIRGGSVRALAVTGTKRSPLLPDVPTIAEAGVPGYQNYVWFGLWAPKKTPQAVVDKLYAEIRKAAATPSVQERIIRDAGVPMDTALKDIEPMEKAEIAKWADVIKRAGIQVQ
ncbi:MAG TPA: tripartite tricarboxylate transporter substrate binding protein [Pseudolabrys sp.]|nr:tripartite tricarboxylate transporter substrate binding protein [Pseudolabrys sp.]